MMQRNVYLVIALIAVAAAGFLFWRTGYVPDQSGIPAGMLQYSSEDGVSFLYPDSYELSSRTEGNGERLWDILVLLPKEYVLPANSEGPPVISMSVFQSDGAAVETWVRGNARSNFKLSADDTLTGTMVGGEPALAYRYSGLYEADAVAVAHRGKIFLFEVGWLTPEDKIVEDFQNLLDTVEFSQ